MRRAATRLRTCNARARSMRVLHARNDTQLASGVVGRAPAADTLERPLLLLLCAHPLKRF